MSKITFTNFLKLIKERDEKIVQEAVKGEKTIREIAEEYGLSRNRIGQILKYYRVSAPLRKGTKKYQTWRERIRETWNKKKNEKNA